MLIFLLLRWFYPKNGYGKASCKPEKIIIMGVYLANLQQPLPSQEKLCEFYFPFGKKKTQQPVELAQALVHIRACWGKKQTCVIRQWVGQRFFGSNRSGLVKVGPGQVQALNFWVHAGLGLTPSLGQASGFHYILIICGFSLIFWAYNLNLYVNSICF